MKKSTRRNSELEPLEPLVLLSAGSKHTPGPTPAPPVVGLSGSIHATGRLAGNRVSVGGSGVLNQVGAVRFQYSARVDNPSASVALESKHGKIILVGDGLLPLGATSGSIHYRVIGGTGSYLGATGSGNASVALGTARGGKATLDVTFS